MIEISKTAQYRKNVKIANLKIYGRKLVEAYRQKSW